MQNTKENKMGIMPENKLLLSMSIPIMISMLIQALYNIVDSIYVAMISENALTAVSLAFPFQNLMIAVATGTGVGVNALLSRSLGEKKFDMVNKTANVSIFLALMSALVFAILGIFSAEKFFAMQIDDKEIIELGSSYLVIVSVVSAGLFGQICFERMLQSTGKTIFSMITQGLGAIVNIILDPIMIFGLGPIPAMGIAGAAWATVIAQIVAAFTGLSFNIRVNKEIKLSIKEVRPIGYVMKKIYAVGVPSILMGSIGSIMTFSMNIILESFTKLAVTVFGVYFKLQSFIFMPVFGLNNGLVPILAYNIGAKKFDRVRKTKRLGTIYATGMMVVGFIIFQAFPEILLGMFNASKDTMAIGVPALRTISYHFLLAGFSIACISMFQGASKGMYSLYVSVTRQLVVLVPAAYLLSLTGKLNLVWLAFPIAELASVIICTFMMKKVNKDILQ